MRYIYSLGIRLYGFAVLIASLFNDKAKKWRNGRKDIFEDLKKIFSTTQSPVIWFHCASLGEFEQGRPVIEEFKQKYPDYKILLTFFSPSGYEVRKNYTGADFIFYLPLDTNSNAKRFIEIAKPNIAVFVKYEFWFHFINILKRKGVPTYLISAKFRGDQYFFQWYGAWFRKQLKVYKKIFVQDAESEQLLLNAGVERVISAGDTRFDRVINIAEQVKPDALVAAFKGNNKLWVCGSTWEEDESLIYGVYNKLIATGQKIKLLLVPHEIGERHVAQLVEKFHALKYSSATAEQAASAEVMVVDKMGLLSSLYQYGDVAYVGGGFGKNVHNLPEAVVFGIPVVFGPNYHKFNEAI
ncbi:MAG TPA: glycosyltransferase N-terminal domain-containing protein, partial [Bacteroidia bacterium]|nr:glycosyltransferase N-terminal domain-containing protein [Bacteroidia bacterium]